MQAFTFPDKLTLGVSACLLGQQVRFDGGHKHSKICTETLAKRFHFVSICPEAAIGLGVPRESIHLQGSPDSDEISLVGTRSKTDVTSAMLSYALEKSTELDYLDGYVFMGRSPSCGLNAIKVYHPNGNPLGKQSSGLFAGIFTQHHPLLPVEEEGRLRDPVLCDNFITRVYVHYRWKQHLNDQQLSLANLQEFHARHKYLIMAHKPAAYQFLGQVVARAHQRPLIDVAQEYHETLMNTLKAPCSSKGHTNVLHHLAGYLKKQLNSQHRQELADIIEEYRLGHVPLIAPMTLLKHFFQMYPNEYIAKQVYLEPHPSDLLLRNFL